MLTLLLYYTYMTTTKKTVYLGNKDILKEIHKSKMTYTWCSDPKFYYYDLIVPNLDMLDNEPTTPTAKWENGPLAEARKTRCDRVGNELWAVAVKEWEAKGSKGEKPKLTNFKPDPETYQLEDLVFRVTTFDHIPQEPGRKNKPKLVSDYHAKINFPPYKHYAKVNGQWEEVARSHWKGTPDDGEFCVDHGQTTRRLAEMYIKLCERYSMRSNWRGYTYVEEMRGQALLQLSQIGLQFDESKSENPFAYYTAAITNSFTRILNIEKKNQVIRDDLLIESGQMPSYTRQLAHEAALADERERNKALKEPVDIEVVGDQLVEVSPTEAEVVPVVTGEAND